MPKPSTCHKPEVKLYVPNSRTETLQSLGLSGKTLHVTLPIEVENLATLAATLDGMDTEHWITDLILDGYRASLEAHAGDADDMREKFRTLYGEPAK